METLYDDILRYIDSCEPGIHSVMRLLSKRMLSCWPEPTDLGRIYWSVNYSSQLINARSVAAFMFGRIYNWKGIEINSFGFYEASKLALELFPHADVTIYEMFMNNAPFDTLAEPTLGGRVFLLPDKTFSEVCTKNDPNIVGGMLNARDYDKLVRVGWNMKCENWFMCWPAKVLTHAADKDTTLAAIMGDNNLQITGTMAWKRNVTIVRIIMHKFELLGDDVDPSCVQSALAQGIRDADAEIVRWCLPRCKPSVVDCYNFAIKRDTTTINAFIANGYVINFRAVFDMCDYDTLEWCEACYPAELARNFSQKVTEADTDRDLFNWILSKSDVYPNVTSAAIANGPIFNLQSAIDVIKPSVVNMQQLLYRNGDLFTLYVRAGMPVPWGELIAHGPQSIIDIVIKLRPDSFADYLSTLPAAPQE